MNGDPVLRAGMAETFKKQATAADLSGHGLGRCLGQLGRELQLGQVHDTAAPGANKVGMGGGVGIKALQILHNPDGNDPALPLKQRQVPVHGGQRKIRDLRLQLVVNPFRAGVCICAANAGKIASRFLLYFLFGSMTHHLFDNNSHLHV